MMKNNISEWKREILMEFSDKIAFIEVVNKENIYSIMPPVQ